MLELSGVDVHYGDFHAVHGATLTAAAGQLTAVVGPNGHGKSTLLKALCGLLPVSAGEIRFKGENIRGLRAPDLVGRGLVYVAEDRRLFPDMTVRENLMLGAFLPRGRARAGANLEFVFSLYPRLKERQGQLVRTMSGGEAQMVALGRGLMSAPDCIAIDEPSLGLAPNLTLAMLKTISALRDNGITIILVEQSLSLIRAHVDAIHLIEEGQVRPFTDAAAVAADIA